MGIRVEKIAVIGDDLEKVSSEIANFSSKYTHVVTSGGIGPTHDDITYKGVALAFKEELALNDELVTLCKRFFGAEHSLQSPQMKMAFIPESAKLHYGFDPESGEKNMYPVITVRNVVVFPGIPKLLQKDFNLLRKTLFRESNITFHYREIFLACDEISVAEILNEFNSKYKDCIQLGCYPDLLNSYYKVKISLECQDGAKLAEAHKELLSMLPSEKVVEYEKDPVKNASSKVYNLLQSTTQPELITPLSKAVKTLEEALDKYKLDEICVGFNGGKDCTILVHLFFAVVQKKYGDNIPGNLQALYIEGKPTFKQQEMFITETFSRYNLKPVIIHGRIKDGLKEMQISHPHVKAVIMGTRRSDPFSEHLEAFCMTDPDWPPFMRVNPILEWTYQEVWALLRALQVPYCLLYDQGYTSLGSRTNTAPNPALRFVDKYGNARYKPAYQLTDGTRERTGRTKSISEIVEK
ncbi:FAD synthase-like isoform X2 [Antedon mediterranea]